MLDALTYAGNLASLAPVRDTSTSSQGDVADAALVDRLVADADLVVHFAAESHNDNSLHDPAAVRADQRRRHVHAARGGAPARRAAAPRLDRRGLRRPRARRPGALPRDDAVQPVEPLLGDQGGQRPAGARLGPLVRRRRRRSPTARTTTARYQHVEKFIPRQITNLLDGVRPKLYGAGANVRDWIHVDDHNAAVWAILDRGRPGETYMIGADGERTTARSSSCCSSCSASPADAYDHVADRPGHDLRYAIDATKLRTELGWTPRFTTSATGLAATVDWYRANEAWWRPQKDATERKYAVLGR